MSDFYTVLRQSMIDRNLRSADEREAAYAQARTAMIRRLWSLEPPLTEDEIDARIGLFDRAVDRIESDLLATFAEADAAALRPARRPASREIALSRPVVRMETARHVPQAWSPADSEDEEDDPPPAEPAYEAPRPAAPPPRPAPPRADPRLAAAAKARAAYEAMEARSLAIEAALRGDPVPEPPPLAAAQAAPLTAYAKPARPQRDPAPVAYREPAPVAYDPEPEPASPGYDEEPEAYPAEHDDYTGARDHEDDEAAPLRVNEAYYDRDGEPLPDGQEERWPEEEAWALPAARTDEPRGRKSRLANLGPRKPFRRNPVHFLVWVVAGLAVVLIGLSGVLLWPVIFGPAPVTTVSTPTPPPAAGAFVIFNGTDPTVFETDSADPVRFDGDPAGGFARISSSAGSNGVRAAIGPGLATRLAGRSVRVTIEVRSSAESGAANLRFAYQSGLAISHWQAADLGTEFASVTLDWRLPSLRTSPDNDYVLIQPGLPGDGTAVDIRMIRIDILPQ